MATMPSDDAKLGEQLVQQERALRELAVVEAAEQMVRSHHRDLLSEELAAIGRELADAKRCLAATRSGGDPYRVALAHEQVCAIQRTANILQQLAQKHDVACRNARTTYLIGQRQVLKAIRGLQRQVLRRLQPPI